MGHDARSIDLLIREHSDFVARLARRLLADPVAAQDLSQEAWQVVIEKRPRGIPDFRAWVTGLVRNLARMHVRSESSRRRREHRVAVVRSEQTADVGARLDEIERLVAALRRLREPFRSAIVLRYHEGLAPRVIARQTGVTVDTVKSRLKRGLAILRADLRSTHGGDEQAWRRGLACLLLGETGRPLRWSMVGAVAAALTVLVAFGVLQALPDDAPARAPAARARVALEGDTAVPDRSGAAVVKVAVPAPPADADGVIEHVLRIVDANTREAVPEFVATAHALDPPLLVSDRYGGLRFAARANRAIELRLIDDLRLRPERPIEAELAGTELRVNIGPTYRLDLRPPPGEADRFEARLVARETHVQHRTSFAPVRVTDTAWVRFAADASHLGGGPPWRRAVRSDDGHRLGVAEVGTVVGVHREVVTIALASTGRVQGLVSEPTGRAIDQAEVTLESEGYRFVGATDAAGAFDLPWIWPGHYTLRASSRLHTPAEVTVVVRAGATAETSLRLSPLPEQGVVEGLLTSDAGRLAPPLPGPVSVVLSQCGDASRSYLQTVTCVGGLAEGALAAFRFEGVPPGPYELAVRAPDFIRWHPAWLCVTPGQAGLELRRRDAEPVSDLELRALDAVTGLALGRFDAFVRLDGDDRTAKVLTSVDGRVVLHHVPLDASIDWTVRASGHMPQGGGRADLAAPVRLEPGWGNTLRCVDRAARPVGGVEIVVDGVFAGSTGADGLLRLRRATGPERISIRPGRWIPVGGDLLPDGHLMDLIWGITVTVETAPPGKPGSPNEDRK